MVHPGKVLAALSSRERLAVFAVAVLHGPASLDELAAAAGVTRVAAVRAVTTLADAGLLAAAGEPGAPVAWAVSQSTLAAATRQVGRLASGPGPEALGADAGQSAVLRGFVEDGRIVRLPARRSKRMVVLDVVAQRFEPGRTYEEPEVNRMLSEVYGDHAELRRALVDDGFLERRRGAYWRAGGRFEV